MLVPQQEGYPCSPHCAGYLREIEQRKEIERLRAALKPFADVGRRLGPTRYADHEIWPTKDGGFRAKTLRHAAEVYDQQSTTQEQK